MDQIETGKFIAQMRKKKNLTQRELADKLMISPKTVSKWECGNGLPEVSLMLPLCDILGISVNELLSGKRLDEVHYAKSAEANILRLCKEREETKFRMIVEVFIIVLTFLAAIPLLLLSEMTAIQVSTKVWLIVSAILILTLGIGICAALEMRKAVFQCRRCKEVFIPTKREYIFGVHTITKRRLRCPKCGKKSWCSRKLRLEEE